MGNIVYNLIFIVFFCITISSCVKKENTLSEQEFCTKDDCSYKQESLYTPGTRYLLYDINPPEGFNLRRDVYLRFAIMVHNFMKTDNPKLNTIKLVLPPWPHLYHWDSQYITDQERLPWNMFFDIPSLQKFAPVIDIYEFFSEIANDSNAVVIDETYVIKNIPEMFETGKFENKLIIEDCKDLHKLNFYGYKNFSTKVEKCLKFHGHADMLKTIFEKSDSRIFMFYQAEIVLHDEYGTKLFWEARRSMRFNKHLENIAIEFRKTYLNSTDDTDNTQRPDDWTLEKPGRNATGGQYLCAHLRRKDFTERCRSPSIRSTAEQLNELLKELKLDTVFISTDGTDSDVTQLLKTIEALKNYENRKNNGQAQRIIKVQRFLPRLTIKQQIKDGGVAIVDQIICSHAAHFIGTYESTFTYRIQEEREILGFPVQKTFNVMCPATGCEETPSEWKIVY